MCGALRERLSFSSSAPHPRRRGVGMVNRQGKRVSRQHVVPGSERMPVAGAKRKGVIKAGEAVEVTVLLRRCKELDLKSVTSGRRVKPMTRDQFAARHGADQRDIDLVQTFARDHGLSIGEVHRGRRSVVLRGTAQAMQNAFGVKLAAYVTPDKVRFRQRHGAVTVPSYLKNVVEGVF